MREHVKAKAEELPAGLELHCDGCGIAVPSDAPRSLLHDCGHVARNKLAHFRAIDPNTGKPETPVAQHVMAVAAWMLIHDPLMRDAGHADRAAAVEYLADYSANRNAHFAKSAVRAAMTDEQIAVVKAHPRDGEFV